MKKKNLLFLFIIFLTSIFQLLYNCNTVQSSGGGNDENENDEKRKDSAYMVDIQLLGSLQNPAWSPDGKSFVFTRFRNGYNEGPADIYTYNLETKELKCLVSDTSDNVNLPGSVWKTNSIVFSSSRDPHDEIYTILDTGNPGQEVKITQRNDDVAYEPSFSMISDFIVFESHKPDDEENGVIVKKDLNADIDSGFISLTDGSDGDCRQPNWSPDGELILYQRLSFNKWDIWVMNDDGTNKKQITTIFDGDNTDASFSPDSQKIIYSGDGDLNYANLYIISVSGIIPNRLTYFNGGYDGAPSWSIDNKVVFESCAGDPDASPGTKIWIINIPNNF